MQKTILVTGGEGFIGRAVCRTLLSSGLVVVSLDLVSHPDRTEGVKFYQGNISDKASLLTLFQENKFNCIIHLASLLNSASRNNPVNATKVNIMGSLHLMELARDYQVARFIYGSSISIYGSCQPSEAVSETHPTLPEDVYGACKYYVETLGRSFNQQYGFNFVALRIATALGAGSIVTSSPWRAELFGKVGANTPFDIHIPYGAGERFPFVYVEEVAAMLERLVNAEQIRHEVYNTPAETWELGTLKLFLEQLNPNLTITLGDTVVTGFPAMISGEVLRQEFAYTPVPLKERWLKQLEVLQGK
ncbi:NAD(P)-dependent oxidoreductase [Candidatus Chlorohelix sp.]|uniref:NAD-dependent epimerase/dehydratase family protein n=1 Tax=Candidatus Chlorohelix sp. TaxID=3139201 RepID=UPI0030675689